MAQGRAPAQGDRGLREFLNHGGFWRFLALLVVYLVIYIGSGKLIAPLAGHYKDDELLSSIGSVFFQITAPLIVGAVVLVALASYLGWTRELFSHRSLHRSWWMWLGPLIVAIPIALRLLGIDWGAHAAGVTGFLLVTGLMIGFVEELTFRGFGVKMIRDGGHGEWAVAALSSLAFALSHSTNLLSGQSIKVVGPTVLYTFGFGVLIYLTLRTTGFLVVAMIAHGLTDPTTILATGGLDKVTRDGADNGFLTTAAAFTFLVIAGGLILLIFIRGQVSERRDEGPAA